LQNRNLRSPLTRFPPVSLINLLHSDSFQKSRRSLGLLFVVLTPGILCDHELRGRKPFCVNETSYRNRVHKRSFNSSLLSFPLSLMRDLNLAEELRRKFCFASGWPNGRGVGLMIRRLQVRILAPTRTVSIARHRGSLMERATDFQSGDPGSIPGPDQSFSAQGDPMDTLEGHVSEAAPTRHDTDGALNR
jgi:hypothetical protein